MFRVKLEKVTTPLTALTVTVPPSVLLPGLLDRAAVTPPEKLGVTFPSASSAVTVKPNPLPAVTVAGGWPVISSCVTTPGVTEMALLVADVNVLLLTASVVLGVLGSLRFSSARWPRFAPQAIAGGLGSANALPLRLRRQVVGSLNLFHTGHSGLGSAELRLAQALADAATIGILQQRTISQSEVVARQLQAALTSRVIIEQAKGVVAERLQVSTDEAFGILRAAARSHNWLLSDLARKVASGSTDVSELLRPSQHS